MSEKQIQNVFPLARKSLFSNQNIFENTFPPDGKIKLAVAGVSQNGREKNSFHQTESRFPVVGMENSFKKTFLLDGEAAIIDRNIKKIKANCYQQQ